MATMTVSLSALETADDGNNKMRSFRSTGVDRSDYTGEVGRGGHAGFQYYGDCRGQ
jgi:hypothetical protein